MAPQVFYHEGLQASNGRRGTGASSVMQPTRRASTLTPKNETEDISTSKTTVDISTDFQDNAPAEGYQEAKSWDGLEVVGTLGDWQDLPENPVDDYAPWAVTSKTPGWSFDDLVSLMHQAIVDCHACHQLLNDPARASRIDAAGLKTLDYKTVDVQIASDGKFIGITQDLRSAGNSVDDAADITDLSEPRLLYEPQNSEFLDASIPVQTPMGFAILKRFAQLTCYRIPDALLNNLVSGDPMKNSIRALLTVLTEEMAPKPRKMAESLMSDEALMAQNNVMIFGRRETSVDKEKEVGRWKVIEAELKARGLPVFGRVQTQRS